MPAFTLGIPAFSMRRGAGRGSVAWFSGGRYNAGENEIVSNANRVMVHWQWKKILRNMNKLSIIMKGENQGQYLIIKASSWYMKYHSIDIQISRGILFLSGISGIVVRLMARRLLPALAVCASNTFNEWLCLYGRWKWKEVSSKNHKRGNEV